MTIGSLLACDFLVDSLVLVDVGGYSLVTANIHVITGKDRQFQYMCCNSRRNQIFMLQ